METQPQRRGLAPSHPGVHLADALDGLKAETGLSRVAVAEALGVGRRTLYDVIEGKRPISPELALRLAALMGASAESWMNLQQAYDLWQARERISAELAGIGQVWPPVERRQSDAA
jgi:addiction module HigA family antidote